MSDKERYMTIDGIRTPITEGETILAAATRIGIEIPTLCHMEGEAPAAACRICVVELGNGSLVAACSETCREGMNVQTQSEKVTASRRFVLKQMLLHHPNSCFVCDRAQGCRRRRIGYCNYDKNCFSCDNVLNCRLRKYCYAYGVDLLGETPAPSEYAKTEFAGFVHDPAHCIRCRRCLRTCQNEGHSLIAALYRGEKATIDFADAAAHRELCASCGKCVETCPTGALSVKKTEGGDGK